MKNTDRIFVVGIFSFQAVAFSAARLALKTELLLRRRCNAWCGICIVSRFTGKMHKKWYFETVVKSERPESTVWNMLCCQWDAGNICWVCAIFTSEDANFAAFCAFCIKVKKLTKAIDRSYKKRYNEAPHEKCGLRTLEKPKKLFQKSSKKVLTKGEDSDIISKLSRERRREAPWKLNNKTNKDSENSFEF